jgi:outer membrane protein assembly factor BamB
MKTHRITLLFSITLYGMVSCLPSSAIYPTVTPGPPITHVANNLVGIKPIWTLDDIFISWNSHDITLDSLMGKTCFLGDMRERESYNTFICLESQDGKLLWSKQTGIQSTIDVTQEGVFVAYSGTGELRKFDLETGDLIARRKLGGAGSLHLTYLNNQVQFTTSSPTLWILNSDLETIDRVKEGPWIIFLSTPEETFVNLKGLQVVRTGTDEVLWEFVDMQRLSQTPIFTENKLFLRNGAGFSGTAYALDRANGELIWEVPNIVGNLAYSANKHLIYALREDGNLLTIDENTGKETVIATFVPNSLLFYDGVDTCAYQLAYDEEEDYLIVYLGDSKQLFAFQEE